MSLQGSVEANEAQAAKTEIVAALHRRLSDDSRSPGELFGVGLTAVSEVAADMIFAAARDQEHGEHLLGIMCAIVRSRWQHLAKKE